ncbi:MAG: hypothetical protein IJD74_02400 [Clostridia bacterium]|nr:hypothetical protein [Clostridia bacterium]
MYTEDHREIITYKDVASNLKKNMLTSKRMIIALMIACTVPICIPLPMMIMGGVYEYAIVVSIPIALIIGYTVYLSIICMRQTGKINDGHFKVREDVLVNVYVRTRPKRSTRSRVDIHEYVFDFESGRQFVVNTAKKDGTRLEFAGKHSNKGDVFYVVTFDDEPNEVVLAYSGAIFQYKQ